MDKNHIYHKFIKYESFPLCKDRYPYQESKDIDSKKCKENIQNWLKKRIVLLEEFNFYIYEFKSNERINNEEIFKESFLFYSIDNALDEQCFILSKKIQPYLDIKDWYQHSKDEIIIINDFDGLGLWIIGKRESFRGVISILKALKS